MINNGISAHGMWKRRLVDAINTGQSEWTPAIVCQDNQCEFGKWLYSCSSADKSSPHFEKVKALHANFHTVAAEVLTLALDSKKEEAEKKIGTSSEYRQISAALTQEMMKWHADES